MLEKIQKNSSCVEINKSLLEIKFIRHYLLKHFELDDNEESNCNNEFSLFNSPVKNKKSKEKSFSSDLITKDKTKSKGNMYINDEELIILQKNDGLRQLTVNSLLMKLQCFKKSTIPMLLS
jgi:hypothetical protein